MSRGILVVVAHPDDEWFGIGGTLLKHRSGFDINIVIVTDGERGDGKGEERLNSSELLCNKMFCNTAKLFGIPANTVQDNYADVVPMLDVLIHQLSPEIIITHWPKDSHQDHRAVSDIVVSSARKSDAAIWMFESPTSIDFTPNYFVGVSNFMKMKMEMYDEYFREEFKLRPRFGTVAMMSVNDYWGTKIQSGYAEAFYMFRVIDK